MLVHAARIALGPILYAQARRLARNRPRATRAGRAAHGVEGAGEVRCAYWSPAIRAPPASALQPRRKRSRGRWHGTSRGVCREAFTGS